VKELQSGQLTELDLTRLTDEIQKIAEDVREAKRFKVKL
jgi:hypothetical protein